MKVQLLVLILYSISVFGKNFFDDFLLKSKHIWRVFERYVNVMSEEIHDKCTFNSNDAYVTYIYEKSTNIRPFISLWIGQESTAFVRSYAAQMAAHLWEKTKPSPIQLLLGTEPIIYPIITREMENEESDLFKEYFFDSGRVKRENVNEIRIRIPELIEIESGDTDEELLVREVITVKELDNYQSLVVRVGKEIYSYNSFAESPTSRKADELHQSYTQELLQQRPDKSIKEYKEQFGPGYIMKTIINPEEEEEKVSLYEELKTILTYVRNNISSTSYLNYPDDWKLLKISHPYDQPRLTTTEEQKRDSLLYRENLIRSFNCYILRNESIGRLFIHIGKDASVILAERALKKGEEMAMRNIWRKVKIVTGYDNSTIFKINFSEPAFNQFDDFQNTYDGSTSYEY